MKKLFTKVVIIFIIVAILIGGTVLVFTHTGYYQSMKGSKQLVTAIENNDIQTASVIIKKYPESVNTLPTTNPWLLQVILELPEVFYPLQVACYIGNNEMIKFLIDNGADVNRVYKGIEGSKPPLSLAISSKSETRLDNVKLLVENGADVNYANDYQSILQYVANSNNEENAVELFEYLEGKGAVVVDNAISDSLLHYACLNNNSTLMHYFIVERKMNINAQNSDGKTPLIYFVSRVGQDNIEDLKFLLESGADKSIKDNAGKTAYDYAVKNGNAEFTAVLKP